MPRKILIINGHPDAKRLGLCHALADAYAEGAVDAGHEVRRVDIAKLDFDLLRSQSAFENEPAPPAIAAEQEAIRWADHLVVIFPLWLGDIPAVLKAFFEQALRPGFAYKYRTSGFPLKLLKGRSARVIVTMGMPAVVYRWFFGGHGVKNLERNILRFVGFGPVRSTLIGGIGRRSGEAIGRSIDAVRTLGDRAA